MEESNNLVGDKESFLSGSSPNIIDNMDWKRKEDAFNLHKKKLVENKIIIKRIYNPNMSGRMRNIWKSKLNKF